MSAQLALYAPTPGEFGSDRDCWSTPAAFVRRVAEALGVVFVLDVCAHPGTARAARFFTEQDDGLAQDWGQMWQAEHFANIAAWCNPPFSIGASAYKGHFGIAAWAVKAREEADKNNPSVMLVPSDLNPAARLALSFANHAIPVIDRVQFVPPPGIKPTSAPFGVHLHLFGEWPNPPKYL